MLADGVVPSRARAAGRQSSAASASVQVLHALVEIHLGCSTHAVGALAEENAVQVEHVRISCLVNSRSKLEGEEHLLELAAQRARSDVSTVLRASCIVIVPAAFAHAARRHVGETARTTPCQSTPGCSKKRSSSAARNAWTTNGRNLLPDRDRDAALLADLRDELAVTREDAQRHLRLHVAQRRRVRNLRGSRYWYAAREPEHHEEREGERETRSTQPGTPSTPRQDLYFPENLRPVPCCCSVPAVHSSRRFKGKPAERRGRKATGLKGCVYP